MSNYLSTSGVFETAINAGVLSTRSKQLRQLVEAVRLYIQCPTQGHIYDVKEKFVAWQNKNPMEFFERGNGLATDFNGEVRALFHQYGLTWNQFRPDEQSEDDLGVMPGVEFEIPSAPAVAMNRWKRLKKSENITRKTIDKVATVAAHTGFIASAASYVGVPGVGVATAGVAAAVSATGFGAIAVPVAIQVGTTVLAAKSYRKTESHLKNLLAIYYSRKTADMQRCEYLHKEDLEIQPNPAIVLNNPPAQPSLRDPRHVVIEDHVLPYVIHQKAKKRIRKAVATVPLMGSIEGVRAMLRKGNKLRKGIAGADRVKSAGWLAAHFLRCDCALSQAIIAELYSGEEMDWMKSQEYEEVKGYLADKMKSV
jgi:hypothetical protein